MWELFRPEVIKASDVPLSSDAGTVFEADAELKESVREVREVAVHVIESVIPTLVRRIEEKQICKPLQSGYGYRGADKDRVQGELKSGIVDELTRTL